MVSASLETPVIKSVGTLPLDSLLAAMIYRESEDIAIAHRDIPLDRTDGLWHGSAAFFCTHELRSKEAKYVRALSMEDLESNQWKLDTKRPLWVDQARNDTAHQWARLIGSYQLISASTVRWFGRGDIDRVSELMAKVTAIGKKSAHGFGIVRPDSLVVIEMPHNAALEWNKKPMRQIPKATWESWGNVAADLDVEYAPCEPPYLESEKVIAVMPGNRFLQRSAFMRIGMAPTPAGSATNKH